MTGGWIFTGDTIRELRRQYRTVAVEDCKWDELQRSKNPEDATEEVRIRYRNLAAVGLFLSMLKESGPTIPLPAAGTTYLCHRCGQACGLDRTRLYHVCESCGERWDQDVNAARNLLAGLRERLDD